MNHVFKEYQSKILEYEKKLKEDYLAELKEINREILITAYKDQLRKEWVNNINEFKERKKEKKNFKNFFNWF